MGEVFGHKREIGWGQGDKRRVFLFVLQSDVDIRLFR